jgi:hypothetical protein
MSTSLMFTSHINRASGIGTPPRSSYTEAKYETNRTEVLKCLLVCFSEGVYLSTGTLRTHFPPSIWPYQL